MNEKETKELGSILEDRFSTKDEKFTRVVNWFEERDEYLRGRFRGRIEAHCESIMDGPRPCSVIPVPARLAAFALGVVQDCRLKGYLEPSEPGWAKLWIYKRDFMLEVIKHLPDKPKSIYEAWILGKAFDYSDDTIEKFCKDKL